MVSRASPVPTENRSDVQLSRRGKLRNKPNEVRTWVDGRYKRVEQLRPKVGAVDVLFGAAQRDGQSGGTLMAGAVAFRAFLFLLPLALSTVLVMGITASTTGTDPGDVVRTSGLPALVGSMVAQSASQDQRGRLLAIAVALFSLWSASGPLLKTVRNAHSIVWGEQPKKPKSKVKAVGTMFAVILVSVLLIRGAAAVRRINPGLGVLSAVVVLAMFTAVWWAASCVLPHGDAPAVALLPGAVLFAVVVQTFHLVTTYYLAGRVESSSQLYGDLGAVATLLLGLYILCRALIAAAILNASLWHRYVRVTSRRTGGGPEPSLDGLRRASPVAGDEGRTR
jgi:uncharacterized BrkB/YihY/UPF0761 family membrane protein